MRCTRAHVVCLTLAYVRVCTVPAPVSWPEYWHLAFFGCKINEAFIGGSNNISVVRPKLCQNDEIVCETEILVKQYNLQHLTNKI